MKGATVPQPESERLADALLRGLRPIVVGLLDSAMAASAGGDSDDELSAADVAHVEALVARRRQRQRQEAPRRRRNACV